ncbi:hypothetical protein E3N88_32746 [Mikania micrantha]|uniref:Uncharacterized protein n=1 Tax=Mikania micrantha TaxID=192012 RepID=A0A5N6M9X8_9ASTR|nr:hypothetical protein E3N88_32746 [Mikania micrantha]
MLCEQSDHHDYHPRYHAPGTFRPTGTPIQPRRLGVQKSKVNDNGIGIEQKDLSGELKLTCYKYVDIL